MSIPVGLGSTTGVERGFNLPQRKSKKEPFKRHKQQLTIMEEEQDITDQQRPSSQDDNNSGGVTAEVGGRTIHISEKQLPFVGMFFAGLVLVTAITVTKKGQDNYAYGVTVAVVAMFFSLVGLFLIRNSSGTDGKFGQYLTYFLFLWCFVGACILTFDGPFPITGNGYFAAWGLAIFSVMGVGVSGSDVKSQMAGFAGSLVGLGASAIIVIIDIADEIDGTYKGESIYALVVACITVLVVGIYLYIYKNAGEASSETSTAKFAIFALFAVLWIILACIVTFRGPFLFTGNGYFGSWGGAIMSVYAAKGALQH